MPARWIESDPRNDLSSTSVIFRAPYSIYWVRLVMLVPSRWFAASYFSAKAHCDRLSHCWHYTRRHRINDWSRRLPSGHLWYRWLEDNTGSDWKWGGDPSIGSVSRPLESNLPLMSSVAVLQRVIYWFWWSMLVRWILMEISQHRLIDI